MAMMEFPSNFLNHPLMEHGVQVSCQDRPPVDERGFDWAYMERLETYFSDPKLLEFAK